MLHGNNTSSKEASLEVVTHVRIRAFENRPNVLAPMAQLGDGNDCANAYDVSRPHTTTCDDFPGIDTTRYDLLPLSAFTTTKYYYYEALPLSTATYN